MPRGAPLVAQVQRVHPQQLAGERRGQLAVHHDQALPGDTWQQACAREPQSGRRGGLFLAVALHQAHCLRQGVSSKIV